MAPTAVCWPIQSGALPTYEAPNAAQPVALGDVITVEGLAGDFAGLTEIVNPILNFVSTGALVVPELLSTDSLSTFYPGAERWEGVLVKVENVVITFVKPIRRLVLA